MARRRTSTRRAGGASVVGDIEIEGKEELLRFLKTVPTAMAKKIMRKALREGAKPIAERARELAPVDSGLTRSAIKVRAATKLRRGLLGAIVMVGEGDYKGEQFYASFIEYGYMKVPTYRGKDGRIYSKPRGTQPLTPVPPDPFMRPAYEQQASTAVKRVAFVIRSEVEKYWEVQMKARSFVPQAAA